MDADMDIDLTLDEDPELARLNAEAAAIAARSQQLQAEDRMRDIEAQPEEGEVDMSEPQPTKVYIRGVDSLTTAHIRDFAREHYEAGDELFRRIEWIDDSSANIVYDTEEAANEALAQFTANPAGEDAQEMLSERGAKGLSSHPDADLRVRQAVVGDVKIKHASKYSRFYLFNPEYDPENRKRKREEQPQDRRVYRKRDADFGRPQSKDEQPFDVNLYDDDDSAMEARRSSVSSHSSSAEVARPRQAPRTNVDRLGGDLFANKSNGRLRSNRSVSPYRDGDGRYGFSEENAAPRRRTPRAITPPRGPRGDNKNARDGLKTELFPRKAHTALGDSMPANDDATELFPNKRRATGADQDNQNDLFPGRASQKSHGDSSRSRAHGGDLFYPSSPNHKRQDAQDLKLIEVAENLGKYNLDGAIPSVITNSAPGSPTYSISGRRAPPSVGNSSAKGKGDLFDRITGGPGSTKGEYGRLQSRKDESPGFSFKGASAGSNGAGKESTSEFSIRGAAENLLVKELFPTKSGDGGSGTGGKDLFDGRIKGRGAAGGGRGRRVGAGDLI